MSWYFMLDANILLNPIRKRPDPEIVNRLAEYGESCVVAAPTIHELVYLCERLPESADRWMLDNYLNDVVRQSLPILDYDLIAAYSHASTRAAQLRYGKRMPLHYGQLDAIASNLDLTIVVSKPEDRAHYSSARSTVWGSDYVCRID